MIRSMPDQPPVEVIVPESLSAGVYANGVGVWSTQHDFTLDFAVNLPPQPAEQEGEQPRNVVQVVARVKIPPAMVFNLLQVLNQQLFAYEQQNGPISSAAGPPLFPPPDLDQGGQE